MSIDNSACNLASLNLMKFRRQDGSFDVHSFEKAIDVVFLAQEIVVSPSSYPTEEITTNARAFRSWAWATRTRRLPDGQRPAVRPPTRGAASPARSRR